MLIFSTNWTVRNLMQKHTSVPFNPNIAYIFYLAGFIESWGRGIEKICEACEKEELPIPEFVINPNDIMVKFTASKKLIVKRPVGVTDGVTDRVTDSEMLVLELLDFDSRYTYTELSDKLQISGKSVAEKIRSLKNKGIITRIGKPKTGYWKINKILRKDKTI